MQGPQVICDDLAFADENWGVAGRIATKGEYRVLEALLLAREERGEVSNS